MLRDRGSSRRRPVTRESSGRARSCPTHHSHAAIPLPDSRPGIARTRVQSRPYPNSKELYMEDVVVIGAGFAGLACAQSAARRGLRVMVLERKPAIGSRVHTTGLLVKEAAEDWEVPARLTRKIHGVRLYAPSLAHIDLDSPGYYFLATDTSALLRWFAREAQRTGAVIIPGRPYAGAYREANTVTLVDSPLRCRYLVGADGPRSAVARDFGLGTNREVLSGIEVELQGVRGVDEDRLHCFLDSELAPGYLGWVVPGVGGITQIGLACRRPFHPNLRVFRRKLESLFDFSQAEVVGRRGGLIPVSGTVHPFGTQGVILAGDAAGLVSPLTAGGIHSALESGWRTGHAIADYLLDAGVEPHRAVAARYRTPLWKRWLRRAFDRDVPNGVYEWALQTRALQTAAQLVYFHKRGPLSAAAWHDVRRTHGQRVLA
ncbi:MAG: NAD(P)/FAD-dependent oxidoreductase [Proteobacteria bacterium]|nr:MAG: NAD(P)/FAD-dependent oxidoreductase [Pseudomonadota bacterium]